MNQKRGLTLMELVAVLAILIALAAIVVPRVGNRIEESRLQGTKVNLTNIRTSLLSMWDDTGLTIAGCTMADLFVQPLWAPMLNPTTGIGWNGPYLDHSGAMFDINQDVTTGAGEQLKLGDAQLKFNRTVFPYGVPRVNRWDNGGPTAFDSWGRPIVIQWPVYDGEYSSFAADQSKYVRIVSAGENGALDTPFNVPYPSRNECGDDLVVYVKVADIRAANVRINPYQ